VFELRLNLLLIFALDKHRLADIDQNIESKLASMRYQLSWLIRTVNLMATITVLDCLMDSKQPNLQRCCFLCMGFQHFELYFTSAAPAVAVGKPDSWNLRK
jgi:hypothetical protein